MAETRDRIITATNELLRRNGYHGTSLSQISEASAATTGSIYHFFPGGKEALVCEVIEVTAAVYRELFEAIMGDSAGVAAGAELFFQSAGDVLESSGYIDPCPIGTIAREVANTSEPLRLAAAAAFDSWIAAGTEMFTRAGIDDGQADELATVLVSMIEGMFVLSRTQRSTAPLAAAGHTMAVLIETVIAGSPTPMR